MRDELAGLDEIGREFYVKEKPETCRSFICLASVFINGEFSKLRRVAMMDDLQLSILIDDF